MERILSYKIEEANNNKPIGRFLRSMGFSSQVIIALKKIPESILCNHKWEYINAILHTGDILTIHIKEESSSQNIVPIPIPISICYEDKDILVLNKPADMPIHPSQNNHDNTLANGVAHYFYSQNIPYVFRCVNRLDRDTTGLTVLAKHMLSAGILSEKVQRRELKREYLAIVSGTSLPFSGSIDAPIAREAGSTISRCIDYEKGERAVTHYQVISRDYHRNLSLLLLQLETGRTHQIRVHMKHLGYPLIGDFIYNNDTTYINRQALHSFRTTFTHPISGKYMELTAPLPWDMLSLFPTALDEFNQLNDRDHCNSK